MDLKYYIVEGSVLPDVFKKVVDVKKLLELDMKISINSACQKVGISRSTYYKYKESVYEFYENKRTKIVTFSMNLENEPGLLSSVLDLIAGSKANILTINQNIPMNGMAIVVVSIETARMEKSVDELLNCLRAARGVKKVDILSRS
jgi:ACT domain-containing protein